MPILPTALKLKNDKICLPEINFNLLVLNKKLQVSQENIMSAILDLIYSDSDSDSDSLDEYEYENCGTQPDGSYMVAGGGMMNGNAYATVEKKNGKYYYCEYGPSAYKKYIGNTIIWSDERQKDGCGLFNIE